MCIVSAVMDYGQRQWPNVGAPNYNPLVQPVSPGLPSKAEQEALKAFRELVRKAEEFDKAADQAHCEDPEKIKLLERIEQRLEALESIVFAVKNA